jgi:hypothetical protein
VERRYWYYYDVRKYYYYYYDARSVLVLVAMLRVWWLLSLMPLMLQLQLLRLPRLPTLRLVLPSFVALFVLLLRYLLLRAIYSTLPPVHASYHRRPVVDQIDAIRAYATNIRCERRPVRTYSVLPVPVPL